MKIKDEHKSLNSLAFKFEDKEEIIIEGEICLAFWHSFAIKKCGIKEIYLATTQAHRKRDVDIRKFNKYIHYIMNESKYKDAINTKRVCDAHRYGISFNVDAPYTHVQSAIVAIRRGWEFPKKLDCWYRLVKDGLHPTFAMAISCFMAPYSGNDYWKSNYGTCNNHEVFCIETFPEAIAWAKSPLSNSYHWTYRDKAYYSFQIFNTNLKLEEFKQDVASPFVIDYQKSKQHSSGWSKVEIIDWNKTVDNLLKLQEELDAKSFY